jgi:hypothetical protein
MTTKANKMFKNNNQKLTLTFPFPEKLSWYKFLHVLLWGLYALEWSIILGGILYVLLSPKIAFLDDGYALYFSSVIILVLIGVHVARLLIKFKEKIIPFFFDIPLMLLVSYATIIHLIPFWGSHLGLTVIQDPQRFALTNTFSSLYFVVGLFLCYFVVYLFRYPYTRILTLLVLLFGSFAQLFGYFPTETHSIVTITSIALFTSLICIGHYSTNLVRIILGIGSLPIFVHLFITYGTSWYGPTISHLPYSIPLIGLGLSFLVLNRITHTSFVHALIRSFSISFSIIWIILVISTIHIGVDLVLLLPLLIALLFLIYDFISRKKHRKKIGIYIAAVLTAFIITLSGLIIEFYTDPKTSTGILLLFWTDVQSLPLSIHTVIFGLGTSQTYTAVGSTFNQYGITGALGFFGIIGGVISFLSKRFAGKRSYHSLILIVLFLGFICFSFLSIWDPYMWFLFWILLAYVLSTIKPTASASLKDISVKHLHPVLEVLRFLCIVIIPIVLYNFVELINNLIFS